MMKRFLILFLISAGALTACKKDRVKGEGAIITEERNVANFYNVESSGSTDVFITQGANFQVTVKGYENIVPYLETKVSNGTLLIGFKPNSNISNDNTEVYITMPALNSITTSGSGNTSAKGNFINADYFSVNLRGSGVVAVESLKAMNYKITIAGSGDVKSFGVDTQQAIVDISGSGDAELTVSKKLTATIKGSGNVYYKGGATVDAKISGSGEVIKK